MRKREIAMLMQCVSPFNKKLSDPNNLAMSKALLINGDKQKNANFSIYLCAVLEKSDISQVIVTPFLFRRNRLSRWFIAKGAGYFIGGQSLQVDDGTVGKPCGVRSKNDIRSVTQGRVGW